MYGQPYQKCDMTSAGMQLAGPSTVRTPHSDCTLIQGGARSKAVPSGSSPDQLTKYQERCIEIVRHNLRHVQADGSDFRNLVSE